MVLKSMRQAKIPKARSVLSGLFDCMQTVIILEPKVLRDIARHTEGVPCRFKTKFRNGCEEKEI